MGDNPVIPPSPPNPSLPPKGITWPMVAYSLVREMTFIVAIIVGGIVAIMFLLKAPEKTIEPVVAALAPILIGSLAKSKPAEPLDVSRLTGGAGLFWLLIRAKMHLLSGGIIGLVFLTACGASQPTPQQEAWVQTYATAEIQCELLANDRPQAKGCIRAVRQIWCAKGAPLEDAGACKPPPPDTPVLDSGVVPVDSSLVDSGIQEGGSDGHGG